MTRPHSATFGFDYPSSTVASTVQRSVELERGEIDGDRTSADLTRDGETLTVVVEADDLTALRAGVNTWTTLVEVAESVTAG